MHPDSCRHAVIDRSLFGSKRTVSHPRTQEIAGMLSEYFGPRTERSAGCQVVQAASQLRTRTASTHRFDFVIT